MAMRAFKAGVVAMAVMWPLAVLLPINFKIALAVGVPYALLAGAVFHKAKGLRR